MTRPTAFLAAALALPLALSACTSGDDQGGQTTADGGAPEQGRIVASPEPAKAPAPSDAADSKKILAPDRLGGLRIGSAPRDGWIADDMQISDECFTYHSPAVEDSYALGEDGTIWRITVSGKSGIRTARGIGIGDTESAARSAYPGIAASPHAYVGPPARYLTWIPQEGGRGLRFETGDDGKVTAIHAGVMPWLGYIEGCA